MISRRGVRTSSTMLRILTWEFKAKDFESSFIEWEHDIEKLDRAYPQYPIPDLVKVGLIMSRLPGQLRHLLLLQHNIGSPYENVRRNGLNYIKSGKIFN